MRVKEAGNLQERLMWQWKLCAGNGPREIPSDKVGIFGRYARNDEPGEGKE